ncbi:LysR family transcriptional regulator [Acrocarpospora phusangensis]|uniref:LysR family transcriptional regulator n=1 Tax=Acrocarpospora phusangensis TaxID=1070424 RepID=A0A919UR71_9ACTN|nr:RidA family protein [Acrocarpospora phusangensis]GIH25250.1 LysR family transcriptional regulator [Acrocarpospora phusangensis]
MSPSERLAALGLTLPDVPAAAGAYVPAVQHGDLVITTGQLPFVDGTLPLTGLVGVDVTATQATALTRQAALNAVAAAAALLGDIDRIARVLSVTGHIACGPDFTGHSAVLDGASTLIVDIFGDTGRHVRTNVGTARLPLNSPVEVSIVATTTA